MLGLKNGIEMKSTKTYETHCELYLLEQGLIKI